MHGIQSATRLFASSCASAVTIMLLVTGYAFAGDRVYPAADAVEPLAVGAQVPRAVVETVKGAPADLMELVGDSGALLVFYRGGW